MCKTTHAGKDRRSGSGLSKSDRSDGTSIPAGRMMMQIVGSFAEFERAMLRERTKNGLAAARQEGRIGGGDLNLRHNNRKKLSC